MSSGDRVPQCLPRAFIPCPASTPCSFSLFPSPHPSKLLPQFVSEAKLAVSRRPSFISPILSQRWLGWPQTNSIMADNTATASKEPNKWSPLCRPNGLDFHLALGSAPNGHKHRLLTRKAHKSQLAVKYMQCWVILLLNSNSLFFWR